jgi:hypothetical protein
VAKAPVAAYAPPAGHGMAKVGIARRYFEEVGGTGRGLDR